MLPSRATSAISTRLAPPNSRLVLHEGLHVLVLERQLLGERGVDVQAARRHDSSAPAVSEREHHHDEQAVAEDQPLERRRRASFRGIFAV